MDYPQAIEYVNSFINYEKNLHELSPTLFRLERVQRLLLALGEPQKRLKFVHVAGTKGKGSTCAMVANILKHQGLRVGLFTSPHIKDVRERIRVLDKGRKTVHSDDIFPDAVPQPAFAALVARLQPVIERFRLDEVLGNLTYFEVLTALALSLFHERKCDVVVLETGLGGRLDATNSVHTLVCGITPISMEHMHLLGDTLDKIAYEKAAIIKNQLQKVVLAPQEKAAAEVLIKRCNQFKIRPQVVGRDITFELKDQDYRRMMLDLHTPKSDHHDLILGLVGHHQLINAAVAVGIIEALQSFDIRVSKQAIAAGLKDIYWPGRFEVLQDDPPLVIDGAHNKASAMALGETVRNVFSGRKIILILGASLLKDIEGMCRAFNRFVDVVIATKSGHPRVHEFTDRELKKFFSGKKFIVTADADEALKKGRELQGSGDVLLCSGSLYLISEVREKCISSKT